MSAQDFIRKKGSFSIKSEFWLRFNRFYFQKLFFIPRTEVE